jgi:hypothetical protein
MVICEKFNIKEEKYKGIADNLPLNLYTMLIIVLENENNPYFFI